VTATAGPTLAQRRVDLVRRHVEVENAQDIDGLLATFATPHYEFVAGGLVADGADAVRELWHEQYAALPDFHVGLRAIHHADDIVFAEVSITATHTGTFMGVAPTGRPLKWDAACVFEFDGALLTNERVYFDSASILEQLGAGPPDPAGSAAELGP
jgi:steroid delta-isomerase-like uncharacterized protein